MSYPSPQPRSPWRTARPVVTVAVVALAAFGVVGSAAWLGRAVGERVGGGGGNGVSSVEPGRDVEIVIPEGASARDIGELLELEGVVRSGGQFTAAVRAAGVGASLRAGRYELVTGMTPDQVIEVLQRGPVVAVFDVTVVEGLRVDEIIDVLASTSGISRDLFEDALLSGQVDSSLREMPETVTLSDWEGLLFPDTYRFSERATAADMLNRMASTMEERMASIDWSGLEAAGFTPYQGIVIASLIESEVRVADERPLVSSVVRNRLADGQRLEIDATVLYALGTRDVALFDREVASAYNTYAVDGLPPTPISAPGRAALEAAAAPADTEFRYYVLSSLDGSHTFSVTFEEHQAAVEKARADGVLP